MCHSQLNSIYILCESLKAIIMCQQRESAEAVFLKQNVCDCSKEIFLVDGMKLCRLAELK